MDEKTTGKLCSLKGHDFASLADYLHRAHYATPVILEIAQKNGLALNQVAGGIDVITNAENLSRLARSVIESVVAQDEKANAAWGLMETYMLGKFFLEGPKVFRPTVEECLALEEIKITIPVKEYAQPFPTFTVEFPRGYQDIRQSTGSDFFGRQESRRPLAMILRHEPPYVWTTTINSTGTAMVQNVAPISETIEQWMDIAKHEDCNNDEIDHLRLYTRIAMNACLFLVDRSIKKLGPDNPKHYERMREAIAKARSPEEKIEAQAKFKSIPVVYSFAQTVSVRRAIGGNAAEGTPTPTGRTMPPHWRSSHWRMQAFGPGRSERKRILIPHTMVNKHLFGGHDDATAVTYK